MLRAPSAPRPTAQSNSKANPSHIRVTIFVRFSIAEAPVQFAAADGGRRCRSAIVPPFCRARGTRWRAMACQAGGAIAAV